MSLRETILAANDLKREEVDLTEEWGCKVYARVMTGLERYEYERWCKEAGEQDAAVTGFIEKTVTLCCVDENGDHVFQGSDVEALRNKGFVAIRKIWNIAAKLNRLSADG